MASADSSTDNGTDPANDSVPFSDWLDPALGWEPADRSAASESEEWPYAIGQAPPSEAEYRAAKEREYERRADEQAVTSDYSDSTEGDD